MKTSNMLMHWPPVLSTFILTRMVELVKDGVDLNRGIKDRTLEKIARSVLLFCGTKVSATQVYNHLWKWRARWNMLKVVAKAEGAEWREEASCFYMDDDAFLKHLTVSCYNSSSSILNCECAVTNYVFIPGTPQGRMCSDPIYLNKGTIPVFLC